MVSGVKAVVVQPKEADLAGDLMLDVETYRWVKSGCYMGYIID